MYLGVTIKALSSQKYSQASEIFLLHDFDLMPGPSNTIEAPFKWGLIKLQSENVSEALNYTEQTKFHGYDIFCQTTEEDGKNLTNP